jgi:hypothetical protein
MIILQSNRHDLTLYIKSILVKVVTKKLFITVDMILLKYISANVSVA